MGINRRKSKHARLQKRFVQIPREQEPRLFEVATQKNMGQGLRRKGNAKIGNQFLFSCIQYRGVPLTKQRLSRMTNKQSSYVVSVSTSPGMDQTCLLCEPVDNPTLFLKRGDTPVIIGVASKQKGAGLVDLPAKIHYETVYINGDPSRNPFASRINGNRWTSEDVTISDLVEERAPRKTLGDLASLSEDTPPYGNCELVAAIAPDSEQTYHIVGCFVYVRGNLTEKYMATGRDSRVESHHFRTPGPGAWLSMNYMSTATGLRAGIITDGAPVRTDALSLRRYQSRVESFIEPVFHIQIPRDALPRTSREKAKSTYGTRGSNFILFDSSQPVSLKRITLLIRALGLMAVESPHAMLMFVSQRSDADGIAKYLRTNGMDVLTSDAPNAKLANLLARRKWLYGR